MTVDRGLERFVGAMPKVELHVHLEGSMQPRTLLELARRRRVSLPADDEEGLRRWFRFRDFEHFVEVYLTCCSCLRDPEDFQLLVDDFLAEQARQEVVHSEVHFTIGTHLGNGANGEEVGQALWEAMQEGERRYGASMRLIPDIVRNTGSRPADATLRWALDHRRSGVVALGLSGFESEPNEPFREHFEIAAQEGLRRVAHAGEHGGPDSVRAALEVCGAERIGHGVRSIEDRQLVRELARRRVPLEICPRSNLCLGVVSSPQEHPIDRLRRAGVPVSVSSDDPPFFGIDLNEEYLGLAEVFGYRVEDLAALALAALRQSFLAPEARADLEAEFRRRFAALGQQHLGGAVRVDGGEPAAVGEGELRGSIGTVDPETYDGRRRDDA